MNESREVPIGHGASPEGQQIDEWIHRITVRGEKTFSGDERTDKHPVEMILQQIAMPGVVKAPCHWFRE